MKIKKIISILFVGLCCLLLSAIAYADEPINPYFAETRPFKLAPRFQTEKSDLTVTLSIPSGITTGNAASFTASVTGGSGEYTYRFEVLSDDLEHGDGYVKTDYYEGTFGSSDTLTYTFWYPAQYIVSVEVKDSNGLTCTFPSYLYYNVTVTGTDVLATHISEIASACPAGDNFSRALWIHDYLINNAEYDNGNNYYSEDGLLMLGKAVCDGYSRSYNRILDLIGVGHYRVESKTHAWNAVELASDEYYHVDTTWDDPGGSGEPLYTFFGLPTEIIKRVSDHMPNDFYFPDCVSYENNYYIRNNVMPWQNSVVESIAEQISDGNRNFTVELPKSVSRPVINYGLSSYILGRDGMNYRDRAMDLSIAYDFDVPLAMGITAAFALNDTDSVIMLPAGLQTLESEAFASTDAVVVVIPAGCIEIESLAMADMTNLDEVHIPASVTEISPDAFANCKDNLLIVTPRESFAKEYASQKDFCVEFIPEYAA